MNRTILLSALLLLGILPSWGEPLRHYHDSITSVSDTTIFLPADTTAPAEFKAIEIRASLPYVKDRQGDSGQSYGLIWGATSPANYYSVTLSPANEAYNHIIDSRFVKLLIQHHTPDSTQILLSRQLKDNIGLENDENSLAVELDNTTRLIRIYAGKKHLSHIETLQSPDDTLPCNGLTGISAVGKAEITLLVTETEPDMTAMLSTGWTSEKLDSYLDSTNRDAYEDYWTYLDRDMDSRYCHSGGKYKLALVSDGHNGYDIIYIEGATINPQRWHTGMKKGHLSPTIFTDHYNLTWTDATLSTLSNECNATFEQQAILTLNFPLLKSSIRLSRVPKDR